MPSKKKILKSIVLDINNNKKHTKKSATPPNLHSSKKNSKNRTPMKNKNIPDDDFINPYYYKGYTMHKNLSFDSNPLNTLNKYIQDEPDKNITYEQISLILKNSDKHIHENTKSSVKNNLDSELLSRICDFN